MFSIREKWSQLVRYLDTGTGSGQHVKSSVDKAALSSSTSSYHKALPARLKLSFSKAADEKAIHRLFEPHIKADIDPEDSVWKRQELYFNDAIDKGHAAILTDDNGHVHGLCFGYATSLDGDMDKSPPEFVETGSVMTTIPGYSTAKVVVSAITLKHWWEAEPTESFSSAIKENNLASKISFEKMGWEKTKDPELSQKISDCCDQNTIPPENKPGVETESENWYVLGPEAIQTKAKILLDYMQSGVLLNKATGHEIELDLSALEDIGLSIPRLEAMAYDGITDKDQLAAITSSASRQRGIKPK